eukprot:3918157-Pleurochrysis_carterae.AAC.1
MPARSKFPPVTARGETCRPRNLRGKAPSLARGRNISRLSKFDLIIIEMLCSLNATLNNIPVPRRQSRFNQSMEGMIRIDPVNAPVPTGARDIPRFSIFDVNAVKLQT